MRKLSGYFSRHHFIESGGYLEIWKVAYPLILMSASNSVMQFVDRMFLAENSTEDVAAALPAGILYFTLFCFFMVTTNFTSALVAQFFGARDNLSCVKAAWSGFYFAVFASLVIVFVIPFAGDFILSHNGHNPLIQGKEKEYFQSLIPCGAFICMSSAFFSFFSGRGKTLCIAMINIAGCGLNIILDYIFIFGKCGMPALGILGAGQATSIAAAFILLCAMILFSSVDQVQFPTRKVRELRMEYLKKLFSFGTPSGLQVLFDVGAFTFVTFMIGNLSEVALASTTIALSINHLSFMPLLGFSQATSIVCGQYIGRDQKDVALKSAYHSWRLTSVYMSFCSMFYLFLPLTLIGMFSPGSKHSAIDFTQVLRYGRWILACAALFNFFDATKFIFMGALRGAGDTKSVLIISSLCAWLLMVPGTVLLIYCKSSIITVWIFLTFCTLVEALIIFWRFRSGAWQKIDLIGKH
ncbi:MAG: MATE family efflux transporter [Victivallaceae bacterium]